MLKYVLVVLLFIVTMPSLAHATTFFDTDFELGASNGWSANGWNDFGQATSGGGADAMKMDSTQFFTGSRSLHLTYTDPSGTTGYNPSIHHSNTSTTHIFFRYMYQQKPGWITSTNGRTKMVRWRSTGGYPIVWTYNTFGNKYGFDIEGPYKGASVIRIDTGRAISTTKWDLVEGEIQYNTPGQANGIARMWVDGVQIINRTDIEYVGPTTSSISEGCGALCPTPSTGQINNTQIYKQSGQGETFIDRMAIADARIGSPDGLPENPGDTTPPTQPTITSLTTSGTANSLVFTASTDTGGSGMASHTILYCSGTIGCTPALVAGTAGATATTFVHSSLTASTLYRYAVRGNDGAGNPSALSAISEITTVAATGSYYTLVFSDLFNRADAVTLGAAWQSGYSTDTAEAVVSNQLRPVSINNDATQTYGTAVANDIAAVLTLSQGNGSGVRAPGILTRYSDPATKDGYECRILLPATARTGEWNTNVFTQKTSVTISPVWAAADKLWCETIGTTTSMYRERAGVKTLLTSFTDATHASGKVGIIHFQASGTLGDVQIDDFNVYSVSSTPPTPPSITNAVINESNTAIAHTFGATTPTQIRVHYGNNAGTRTSNTVRPIADFPSGVLTITLPDGTEYYCARPFDSAGVEHSSLGRCINTSSIIAGVDVNPVVMSNPFPATNRPADTEEVDYGVELDKPASCRSHTSDVSYADMAPPTGTDLTTSGLVASGTQTGLTNGSTTTLYVRCNFVNEFDEEYPNLTSQAISIVVDNATADTDPPGAPTDPVASPILNSSDITVVWGAASGGDVAKYHVYKAIYSEGACGTYAASGNPVAATSIQVANAPLTAYCFKIQAEDTSGNPGAFSVETAPVTTGQLPDLDPPSDAGNLTVQPYASSAVFSWPAATDNRGKPTSTIELCQGAACTSFVSERTGLKDESVEIGLTPGTFYRARLIHCDLAELCGAYSPIIGFTTAEGGLSFPRAEPIQQRATAPDRPVAPQRATRPQQ